MRSQVVRDYRITEIIRENKFETVSNSHQLRK